MPLSPHELGSLAARLRACGPREARKPIVQILADWLEATQGRRFDRPRWVGAALGPIEPMAPKPTTIRDANGISHLPPATPQAKIFRAWDSPDRLGL